MDVTENALPRWMQGDWARRAPLRAPARSARSAQAAPETADVSAKPQVAPVAELLLQTSPAPVDYQETIVTRTAPRPRQPLSWLAALLLALVTALTIATQGLATRERGLTVTLPAAQPLLMPASAPEGGPLDPPGDAYQLTPLEAAAVRRAIEADLAGADLTGPKPAGIAFNGATPLDRERALTCMTQAIYYEAGTESEAGQRAVAQVILNRVRHPDYPDSVCGVVYQGAMRAGGGCQFTFTCDGAMARRPVPAIWARAQGYARQALAGRAFGDVGYATHYHTFEVWPHWGRRLTMTNMIGRHLFHRLRGAGGGPRAFTRRYAGHEPAPRPWTPRPADGVAAGGIDIALAAAIEAAAAQPANNLPPAPVALREAAQPVEAEPNNLPVSRPREDALPDSQIRPEYRQSGRWIAG